MCIYMESVKHKHCYEWFARQNGELYLCYVAGCLAVCGVSKVAIVTILCGGKCQSECILTQMALLCQNDFRSHYTTFSHTRPVHGDVLISSGATERS